MTQADAPGDALAAAFTEVVDFLAGTTQAEGDRPASAAFAHGRDVIVSYGPAAVPFLAKRLEDDAFVAKDGAYDLLVGLGPSADENIASAIPHAAPAAQLWLASVLHLHHDAAGPHVLVRAVAPASYAGRLAALAVVLQGLARDMPPQRLGDTLVDALDSDERIEGSIFFVADSALACLTLVGGERFSALQPPSVELLNFSEYVFPPPSHPFPYANQRLVTYPPDERRATIARARAWWAAQRDGFRPREVVSPFG